MRSLRGRFWFESVGAGLSTALFVTTLLWHDWIELIFHVDPDHGSGSLEWVVTITFAVVALGCTLLARAEWRATPIGSDRAG